MKPITFLFNAEYDFQLRSNSVPPKLKLATESMAPLFTPAFSEEDTILSEIEMDSTFYDYLEECSITAARLVSRKNSSPRDAEAWGWSEDAIEELNARKFTFKNPAPEVCRDLNSRGFATYIADKYGYGVPQTKQVTQFEQLTEWVEQFEGTDFVLKPLFGNAGAGFIHSSKVTFADDMERIKNVLHKEECVVEPWLERTVDLASVFRVKQNGDIDIIGHHKNICNRIGAFFGTLISNDDTDILDYQNQLESMIVKVGNEAYERGYFGVISIDSFCYLSDGNEKVALAIDINCRYTMSYIAHMVYRKMGVPTLFYRFMARKRHTLPTTYSAFDSLLGSLSFRENKSEGVVLLSPLKITGSDGVIRQPQRTAFAVVGNTAESVSKMDTDLRECMLNTKKKIPTQK